VTYEISLQSLLSFNIYVAFNHLKSCEHLLS
jgi:hypothetical protein